MYIQHYSEMSGHMERCDMMMYTTEASDILQKWLTNAGGTTYLTKRRNLFRYQGNDPVLGTWFRSDVAWRAHFDNPASKCIEWASYTRTHSIGSERGVVLTQYCHNNSQEDVAPLHAYQEMNPATHLGHIMPRPVPPVLCDNPFLLYPRTSLPMSLMF